jgi:hypothetical protein
MHGDMELKGSRTVQTLLIDVFYSIKSCNDMKASAVAGVMGITGTMESAEVSYR